MIRAALALAGRDLRLAARIGGAGALPLVFSLLVVTLVPFGLGPDLALLGRIGPAILWIAAVLATLIGLDRLFGADAEDGALDLLRLSPAPLELLVLAKIGAYWLTTGLPLAILAPLFGLLLALDPAQSGRTALALLLGTPALACVGAVGAALTASLRRGGLILAVVAVPFMVPPLIFGVAASDPENPGRDQALLVLAGLALGSAAVAAVAAAAALRSPD